MQTLTGRPNPTIQRARLFVARTHEQQHLVILRQARAQCCGCVTCGDSGRIEELAALIQRATEAVDELGNQYCERETTC